MTRYQRLLRREPVTTPGAIGEIAWPDVSAGKLCSFHVPTARHVGSGQQERQRQRWRCGGKQTRGVPEGVVERALHECDVPMHVDYGDPHVLVPAQCPQGGEMFVTSIQTRTPAFRPRATSSCALSNRA